MMPTDVATLVHTPLSPEVPTDLIWRLSVKQYHEMIQSGILMDGDPVELLEGWLVQKMSKNPPHSIATRRLRKWFEKLLGDGWTVDSQEPITLSDSEPEPDVAVVRGDPRVGFGRHPVPGEFPLVCEVADDSIRRDRGTKKRIYARAQIPVYWIVNLVGQQIEVYTDPTGPTDQPTYRERRDYKTGDRIPVMIDGREIGQIAVGDILP